MSDANDERTISLYFLYKCTDALTLLTVSTYNECRYSLSKYNINNVKTFSVYFFENCADTVNILTVSVYKKCE